MRTYIKSFRLLNFQSWDNKSQSIPVESDIVNIIEGANETGKSVLYKVMYNMCFPGYWDANELIRRGYDTACLFFELSNGCEIGYELNRSHHTYYLQENNNLTQWSNCGIPDTIVEMLGLILDTESQVILNVIDKDVPLPFIKTSPKFNASLIRAVVEPVKITDFFARTNEHLKEVDIARSEFKSRRNAAREASAVLEFRNIDALRLEKQRVDDLTTVVDEFLVLQQVVDTIAQLMQNPPVEVIEPYYAGQLITVLDAVKNSSLQLMRIVAIQQSRPKAMMSPDSVRQLVTLFSELKVVSSVMDAVLQVYRARPVEVNLPDIQSSIELLDTMRLAVTALNKTASIVFEEDETDKKMQNLEADLEKIRSEVGVCPTCGRLL